MNHISVLKNETISLLNIKPDGFYLDLTLGRGGHSIEILKRLNKGILYAFDLDKEAIKESDLLLSKKYKNYKLIHDNFKNFDNYINEKVDGILLDLGVSSPQFDDGKRGFSYRIDSQLDMRMNQDSSLTAKKIVNTYSLDELTKIFREYGEEKDAYKIALNIIKEREKSEINSTFELVNIIKKSKSNKSLEKKGHPAKQVFQALRIAVNDELTSLEVVLSKALKVLNKGGVLVVISFHSLEDRIVKNAFNKVCKTIGNRFDDSVLPSSLKKEYSLLNNKVITPSEEEINVNPRSKSAKLRAIRRL